MASDRYSGYLARKQTHVHKLAIVLTAAKRDRKVIELEELQAAEQLVRDIEVDMIKVFESIGVVDEARHVAEIVALVRAHKLITSDELWTQCLNLMPMTLFESALKSAIRGGLLRVGTIKNGKSAIELIPKGGQDPTSDVP